MAAQVQKTHETYTREEKNLYVLLTAVEKYEKKQIPTKTTHDLFTLTTGESSLKNIVVERFRKEGDSLLQLLKSMENMKVA